MKNTLPHTPTGVFRFLLCSCLTLYVVSVSSLTFAQGEDPLLLDQAKRIHDRLAGVPPSEQVLVQMVELLKGGKARGAADVAMQNKNFYNVTLKNWAAPWTNRDMDVFVPLNDYIATVIGTIRDNRDYREILTGSDVYVGSVTPAYTGNPSNNDHYENLEESDLDLRNDLSPVAQSSVFGFPASAAAGVVTTRAAAKAFFIAGTNRAQFRFTLLNHLCLDLEQVHDISRVPDRIRQDVSRSPGGDSRVFFNNCIGCHSGMDPMAQAFAYYDYDYDLDADPTGEDGQIIYTAGQVRPKYFNNDTTFPPGFVTPDDSWANYWREGINANLGWDTGSEGTAASGTRTGARSMLMELANTRQFAQCAVEKVFRAVCLRDPMNPAEERLVKEEITARFIGDYEYNLKSVFAETAVYCSGGAN